MLKRMRIYLKKLLASVGLLTAEVLLTVSVFIISIATFSFFVKEIFIDRKELFDLKAFNYVARFTTPFNTSLMQQITFLGTHKFLIPANLILTGYFLFVRKHKWHSIKVATIALSSTALMLLLKNIFSRQRPFFPLVEPALGYSFPSGHSMMSFSFYGLLIYLAARYINEKWLKTVAIFALAALIMLIGFSRVYLRVHYASDVLAGFSVGSIWLLFSIWVLNKIEGFSKAALEPVITE